nr:hypothetical protein [Thioalkalivibrio sp. ALMg11]
MAQALRSRISMHDGVTVWCDCCSCEAEPYWAEVAEELGIDPDPGVARGGRARGSVAAPDRVTGADAAVGPDAAA